MNILLVDDQKAIVESIKNGISWEELGVERVFTACSTKEAKLWLVNFDIDILLTDIEMPEEDGLELFRWSREHKPGLIGIFLTSHADFAYAKEAISLGGFDYILQPARYEEIEQVVAAAAKKIQQNVRIRKLEKKAKLMMEQRDSILDLMLVRIREGKAEENENLFSRLLEMFDMEYQNCVFWPVEIQVVHFKKVSSGWDEKLIKNVFRNVLEELLEEEKAKVCISSLGISEYLVFVAAEEATISDEKWNQTLHEFWQFINAHMDFLVAVYPEDQAMKELRIDRIVAIWERKNANVGKKAEIFWCDVKKDPELVVNEERIRMAVEYIKNNISRNISRSEVAKMLHLNEEYFSRLFKKYTGYTFKDYEMMERINQAKRLLEHSHFSISIIASKVGYDNFSHFSKVFKKTTGYTPQEYRKKKEKEKQNTASQPMS